MVAFNRHIFLSFLLFWYLTSITQALLFFSGGEINGLRDATIIAFLWLIPVLLLPKHAKKVTATLALIIWLFALPGFGYFLIYGQELTQSLMYIVFESNALESSEYLENYMSFQVLISYLAFTLVPIFIWSKIQAIQITKKSAYISCLIIFSLIFITPFLKLVRHDVDKAYSSIHRHFSVAPPWQLVLGYNDYKRELKAIENNLLGLNTIPPLKNLTEAPKTLPTTVVIVIGESTTRMHMSLYGYQRDTNPALTSIKHELIAFNNVFSSRPSTIESLEQVLTFADQKHPDDYKTTPSIISMMKQSGYKTYWITNQQTMTKRNTMLTTFAKQADEQVFLNNARKQNSYSFDEKVLAPFTEKLADTVEKKCIVVHLLGTHMNYQYRYPEKYQHFKDSNDIPSGVSSDKVQLINEYDNAVRYNDHVVYELINRLKQAKQEQQSLLVYFSDHGEDVYDTKPFAFQGRNEGKPTYPMYAIPFVIWHSQNWDGANKFNDESIQNRQYDNADFIYTWSDLMGISYDGYREDESILSQDFSPDDILVGNPYQPSDLKVLAGTKRGGHIPSVLTPLMD